MVDKVTIQKIGNGYVVSTNWFNIDKENTCHFKDMDDVCKHLDRCFGAIDRVIKEKQLTITEEQCIMNTDKLGMIAFGKVKQLEKKIKELEERIKLLEETVEETTEE